MRATAILLLSAALLLPGPGAFAQDPAPPAKETLGERVNRAIDAGVAWLRKQAVPRGNFALEVKHAGTYDPSRPGYYYPAGTTALALYTLLKCGVPAKDPVIQNGFSWLRNDQGLGSAGGSGTTSTGRGGRVPGSTYEIAVTILALEARSNPHKREKEREREARFHLKKGEKLDMGVRLPPEDRAWMEDLVATMERRRGDHPAWRYNIEQGGGVVWAGAGGDVDMSATMMALLGLLAAERCGIHQPDATCVSALDWVLGQQEEKGPKVKRAGTGAKPTEDDRYGLNMDEARGWAYMKAATNPREASVSGAMTSCGLASVLIPSTLLQAAGGREFASRAAKAEKAWYDGQAWLQEHWSVADNPGCTGCYHFYSLYCLERVGDLKGVRLLAGHDWYTEGATVLVGQQRPDGSWLKRDTHDPQDVLNTCFALLFLDRSTRAITTE
jgi:hypothetical protein